MIFEYKPEKNVLQITQASNIELRQLKRWLTRMPPNARFDPRFIARVWDGKISLYNKNGEYNVGLWKEFANACAALGTEFKVSNKEKFPINRDVTLQGVQEFVDKYFEYHMYGDGALIPYDYQVEAAYKILRNKFCNIQVATSGGKSLIISMIILYYLNNINKDSKVLIIVPNITLVTQITGDLIGFNFSENIMKEYENEIDFYNFDDDDLIKIREKYPEYNCTSIRCEQIMSDKPRKYKGKISANIFIACDKSLIDCDNEFMEMFDVVIVDEAHKTKAKTLQDILTKSFKTANYRFGVSGSYPHEDSLDILTIQNVLGPIVYTIKAKELMDRGTISQVNVKILILNHNKPELNTRLQAARKAGNGKKVFDLEKETVSASTKRLDFIVKLVSKFNKNSLILFDRIDYGNELFDYLSEKLPHMDFHYIDGKVKSKVRDDIKKDLGDTKNNTKILIASYGTLSTGVSIKALFNVVFAESFKSEIIIKQSIGRALRLHEEKNMATIYDLVDIFDPLNMNNILFSHHKKRESLYHEQEFPYEIKKINL